MNTNLARKEVNLVIRKIVAVFGILALLLGLIALVVPDNQSVVAANKDGQCYMICAQWCPPLICGTSNVCWLWVEYCPEKPAPTKK